VSGWTLSSDFPVFDAAQPTLTGPADGFLSKLSLSGSSFIYSTYIGGSGHDAAGTAYVDPDGNVYLGGSTTSEDFPTFRAVQSHLAGETDGFLIKLDRAGTVIYWTCFGGTGGESAGAVADAAGNAYLTGSTSSTDLPTKDPLQPALVGSTDFFFAKITDRRCPQDVTDRVDVVRFPFLRLPFTPFRFQVVLIHNKTTAPITGPLALVVGDAQNGVIIGTPLITRCFSSRGDPFIVVTPGADNRLSPNESTFTGLWFVKTHSGRITYTPHVLSGGPAQ